MNFSPDNEGGLLSLVEALKAGLNPEIGYQLMGGIESDQAAMVAQRQQRLSGLADLLMGAAQGGMPFGGAEALAEAAPGPAGPAVQNMLGSLYPGAQQEGPPVPSGVFAPQAAAGGDMSLSPAFVDQTAADPMLALQMAAATQDLETGELQQQALQQEIEAGPDPADEAWAGLLTEAMNGKAAGDDSTTFYSKFILANPSLRPILNAEPAKVHKILQLVFHPEG